LGEQCTTVPASAVLKGLRKKCLSANEVVPGMELAARLQKAGVQGLVFPSVVPGGDDNLIVYLANCKAGSLKLENEAELIAQGGQIVQGLDNQPRPDRTRFRFEG